MMDRRSLVVVLAIGAVLLTGAGFALASDRITLYAEDLRATEQTGDGNERTVEFVRDDESVATVALELVRHPREDIHPIRVNVVTGDDVRLRGLQLRFEFDDALPSFALQTPGGYPWPPIEFHRSRDGSAVVVRIGDAGIQGEGSLTLEFLIGPLAVDEPPPTFTMHTTVELVEARSVAALVGRTSLAAPRSDADNGVVVTFRVGGREEFRVLVTKPEEIETARRLARGEQAPSIPIGVVVRGETGVNEGWSWHIDPATFEFAEVTTEVCDGQPSGVESRQITSDRYCPWNAEVIDIQPAHRNG